MRGPACVMHIIRTPFLCRWPHITRARVSLLLRENLRRVKRKHPGCGGKKRERVHFFREAEVADAGAEAVRFVADEDVLRFDVAVDDIRSRTSRPDATIAPYDFARVRAE